MSDLHKNCWRQYTYTSSDVPSPGTFVGSEVFTTRVSLFIQLAISDGTTFSTGAAVKEPRLP
ncbi:hypothetical protein DPMN_177650 [Dreissena polymorpha]|uniref:Uncharacterized protein n=1 Tax=Dreissena polymorpha TaxID=45954 RepID=A0A9D4EBI0_DREPO|nr:hypothetical protein DPMN_177650 [Dreissena polymorpha]